MYWVHWSNAMQRVCITGGISCNKGSALGKTARFPVEVEVGPEFVTGSTRMKAGTAQKAGFEYDQHHHHDSPGPGKRQ